MYTVGYLGPEGTFTQEAALIYCNGNYKLKQYMNINDLITGVDRMEIDLCVAPIENSIEGSVNVTIDKLANEINNKIIGELIIPIKHCLLVSGDGELNNIKHLLSHEQAIAQCQGFINRLLKGVVIEYTHSTAAAVQTVVEKGTGYGAIGTKRAAQIYGVKILEEDIQDNDNNSTRFIVIGKDMPKPTGDDKTSIVFSVDDKPGSLYNILNIFADKGINLTKIESRPMKKTLGQYMFFVDIQGHADDEIIKTTLKTISTQCIFYKYLGSYPLFRI